MIKAVLLLYRHVPGPTLPDRNLFLSGCFLLAQTPQVKTSQNSLLQNYEKLHPNHGYIKAVSVPRLKRFQAKFPELIKEGSH